MLSPKLLTECQIFISKIHQHLSSKDLCFFFIHIMLLYMPVFLTCAFHQIQLENIQKSFGHKAEHQKMAFTIFLSWTILAIACTVFSSTCQGLTPNTTEISGFLILIRLNLIRLCHTYFNCINNLLICWTYRIILILVMVYCVMSCPSN